MDRNGKRTGQATADTAFDSAHPFTLTMAEPAGGWPVLVDLQMRPVTPTRLSYADECTGLARRDVDGQIQHGADSKLKDSTNGRASTTRTMTSAATAICGCAACSRS